MEWSETDIILACQKQDKQAQMALFHRYKEKLFGICLRYIPDHDAAEEILMDSYITIFEKINSYKEKNFEGWIKTIVINKAIDYYRKHKNDPLISNIEEVEWQTPQNFQGNSLEVQDLLNMLHFLPDGYRMVFNLYAIEGYQHKDIAKKLNVTENTSKTQFHKAKLKLQEMIKKGGYNV